MIHALKGVDILFLKGDFMTLNPVDWKSTNTLKNFFDTCTDLPKTVVLKANVVSVDRKTAYVEYVSFDEDDNEIVERELHGFFVFSVQLCDINLTCTTDMDTTDINGVRFKDKKVSLAKLEYLNQRLEIYGLDGEDRQKYFNWCSSSRRFRIQRHLRGSGFPIEVSVYISCYYGTKNICVSLNKEQEELLIDFTTKILLDKKRIDANNREVAKFLKAPLWNPP